MQADTEYRLHLLLIIVEMNNHLHYHFFLITFLINCFVFSSELKFTYILDSYAYIISFIQIYVLYEKVSDNF